MSLKSLRISARSSQLAKLQAYMVGEELQKHYPALKVKYEFRESLGDKNLTDPLWKMPEKGVFTEDFYLDLVNDKTDIVVHSWKDLPVEPKPDTFISATLPRADQRDILILKKSSIMKKNLKLLTSSPRREYNLKPFLSTALPQQPTQIDFGNIRGNVPTRLRKLFAEPSADGLVLAKAAVDRFLMSTMPELQDVQKEIKSYFQQNRWMVLPLTVNPNAAAQGALALEIKSDNQELHKFLTAIHCEKTFKSAQHERRTLKSYGGGCHQKIGVSHLFRPYGQIFFLQGLTDQGVVLSKKSFSPKFSEERTERFFQKRWSSGSLQKYVTKTDLPAQIPNDVKALYVSHKSAWRHINLTTTPFIWTAGLETWKSLAAQGVWVNGSSEGIGENEDKRIDHLTGSISWTKLTHNQVEDPTNSIFTYSLSLKIAETDFTEIEKQIEAADVLFWSSPFYFKTIFKRFPQILQKKHACGLGQTQSYLMRKHKINPYLFLNEQEFLDL